MSPQSETLFAGTDEPSAAAPAPSTRHQREISAQILRVVMAHQRLATDDRCVRRPCDRCIEVHRGRVMWFVSRGIPVEFVLPAFPAKSPNTAKVLGATPDMAERLSLHRTDAARRAVRRAALLRPRLASRGSCRRGQLHAATRPGALRQEMWTPPAARPCPR
jgi:hypothetical protein